MIIGVSPAIRRALLLAEQYARTDLPVLLVGATGTGKELFAQHIHQRSGRPGPLVDVNCAALPRDIVESLLFGHARGAFTGATESSVGHVQRSDGGTLFLDELGSLVPEAQGKLLRVLDAGEVQPLGAYMKRKVDLRVLAAAQDDLSDIVETGRFRRDLFQRVAGLVIHLPPLARRREDIMPLAEHFSKVIGKRLQSRTERVLLDYSWPGNARELRQVIERASHLVADGVLPPGALIEAIELGAPPPLWGLPTSATPLDWRRASGTADRVRGGALERGSGSTRVGGPSGDAVSPFEAGRYLSPSPLVSDSRQSHCRTRVARLPCDCATLPQSTRDVTPCAASNVTASTARHVGCVEECCPSQLSSFHVSCSRSPVSARPKILSCSPSFATIR